MKRRKLIGYLSILAVLLCSFMLMGASCSVSSANVSDAVMTTAVDENYEPVDTVTSFAAGSIAYVSAQLHNAPDDTTITFVWYANDAQVAEYSTGNEGQTEAAIACGTDQTTQPGNYKVEIYIDEREDPDAVVEFTVQ